MAQKRLSDKGRQVLRKGEGQRSNGSYYYRWTDQAGERHTIYSKSLTVLREREKELDLDKADGIKYEAIAAWDLLISHAPSVPKAKVSNHKDRLG